MRLKLVVFDVDGTLVDSQALIVASMDAAFAAEGLSPPGRGVLAVVGLSLPLAIAGLLPSADADRVGRMAEVYKTTYAALRAADGPGAVPFYPGARAALDRLRSRDDVLLGIATGKSRRGLTHLVETHGLTGWFQTLHCADDHPSKPHPSMLHATLRDTGVEAVDAVIVGDTSFDMDMGRAAGFGCIGVSWGYHPAEALVRAGAAGVLERFDDLDATLDRIWEMTDG